MQKLTASAPAVSAMAAPYMQLDSLRRGSKICGIIMVAWGACGLLISAAVISNILSIVAGSAALCTFMTIEVCVAE